MRLKSFILIIVCFSCLFLNGCDKSINQLVEHVYKSPNIFWGEHLAIDSKGDVFYIESGFPDRLVWKDVVSGESSSLFTAQNMHSISVDTNAIYFIGDSKIGRYDRKTDSVEYLYDVQFEQCSLFVEEDKVSLTTWEILTSSQGGAKYSVYNYFFEYQNHILVEVARFHMPVGYEVQETLATESEIMHHFYQFYVDMGIEGDNDYYLWVDSFYLTEDYFCNPGNYRCEITGNQVIAFQNNGTLYLCTPGYVENGSSTSHKFFGIDNEQYQVTPRQSFQQDGNIYLVASTEERYGPPKFFRDAIIAIDVQNQTSEIVTVFDGETTVIGYANTCVYIIKKDGGVYACDIQGEVICKLGTVNMKRAQKVYVELCDKAVFVGVDYGKTVKSYIFDI